MQTSRNWNPCWVLVFVFLFFSPLKGGAGFLPLRSQWEDIWQSIFFVTQEQRKNWEARFGRYCWNNPSRALSSDTRHEIDGKLNPWWSSCWSGYSLSWDWSLVGTNGVAVILLVINVASLPKWYCWSMLRGSCIIWIEGFVLNPMVHFYLYGAYQLTQAGSHEENTLTIHVKCIFFSFFFFFLFVSVQIWRFSMS